MDDTEHFVNEADQFLNDTDDEETSRKRGFSNLSSPFNLQQPLSPHPYAPPHHRPSYMAPPSKKRKLSVNTHLNQMRINPSQTGPWLMKSNSNLNSNSMETVPLSEKNKNKKKGRKKKEKRDPSKPQKQFRTILPGVYVVSGDSDHPYKVIFSAETKWNIVNIYNKLHSTDYRINAKQMNRTKTKLNAKQALQYFIDLNPNAIQIVNELKSQGTKHRFYQDLKSYTKEKRKQKETPIDEAKSKWILKRSKIFILLLQNTLETEKYDIESVVSSIQDGYKRTYAVTEHNHNAVDQKYITLSESKLELKRKWYTDNVNENMKDLILRQKTLNTEMSTCTKTDDRYSVN